MLKPKLKFVSALLFSVFLHPFAIARSQTPDWVAFPDKEWQTITPEAAGNHNLDAWNEWVKAMTKHTRGNSFQGEDHRGDRWGVTVTRGGYLIQTFGNPDYKFQTASLGKAFTITCLQLAIDEGLHQ